MFRSLVLLIVGLAAVAHAFEDGAPDTVCQSLTPGHGAEPQTIPSPYKLAISEEAIHPGDTVKVTLEGKTDDDKFKGFICVARKGEKNVGSFVVDANDGEVQTLDCPEGTKNAVTHRNPNDKKKVDIIWQAPVDLQGKLVFLCTTVKSGPVYWVAQSSAELVVRHR